MMRTRSSRGALLAAAACALAFMPSAFSQTDETAVAEPVKTSKSDGADSPAMSDEVIVLTPFAIEAAEDKGYQGKSTLAATRVRTDLKDVGSALSVITSGFLKDTNSKNAEQLLVYTTNTEVAGQGGNFLGQGDGPFVTGSALNRPVANTRVRGLAEADNTRDYFLSDIPWDSYNVGRVDLQRGPNSMLFGVGSPAGIVNSSLNAAGFKDLYKVENQLGSFGTVRFTGNLNKELLDDELAVRVDLLNDKTKYRQDPAYRDDKRIFSALRYDPSFLNQGTAHTSLRINFEKGKVDSNMPRYTPPIDTITPWFGAMAKATYDGRTLDNNQPNAFIGPIGNRVYDGVATTFNDGTQGLSFPTKVQGNPPSASNVGRNAIKGIATTDLYAKQAGLVGAGSGLWKAASITDPNIFDFYNNLIEGPNKSEFNKFHAFSASLSQTFLKDMLGFELAYDRQNARWGNDTSMADDGSTVTIDINNTLLDGSPNPNVGRPMVVLGGGSAGVYREERDYDVARATAFADLNFAELLGKDSLVARIFGRNTFTTLVSRQKKDDQNQKGPRWYLSGAFAPNAGAGGIGQASRDNIVLAYVGPSMAGANSASSLGFKGLKHKVYPQNGSIRVWDATANSGAGGFATTPLLIVNSDDYDDSAKTYTNAYKSSETVTSSALIWQGYWFDHALVPMIGIRRDKLENKGRSAPGLAGVAGAVNIHDPAWQLVNEHDLNTGKIYMNESGTSKTYSIVTHIPKSLRSKMPMGTDISLIFNKSENFKPEPRRSVRGQPIPSATGKTEEYGIAITTLNDRLTIKVVNFLTKVRNASLNGAIAGQYLIGAVEWWGGNAARAQRDNNGWQAGNYGTTTGGQVLTVEPDITVGNTTYNAHLAQVLSSTGTPLTIGTKPDGAPLYSQLAIDTTYNDYQASINDWFANLAPADMQGAWEFVSNSTGTGVKDGNYSPASMTITGDTKSRGWEYEVLYTPIDGFDVSINASRTTAIRRNLASSYGEWIEQRWRDFQGPMGDIRIWGGGANGETTRSKFRNETYAGYLFFNALQKSNVPELAKWRVNVVTNYSLKQGFLKGSNVGASYRWTQARTIGFLSKSTMDPISNTPIDVADLTRPVSGESEKAVDLWIGYQRKIYKDLNWRIQLNIRNVFAKDKLIPNTIQPDGSVATYRIAEPRTITLTNTLEF